MALDLEHCSEPWDHPKTMETMETKALDLEHCDEPWDHGSKTMETKALDLENCNDPWDLNDIVPSPIEVKYIYHDILKNLHWLAS